MLSEMLFCLKFCATISESCHFYIERYLHLFFPVIWYIPFISKLFVIFAVRYRLYLSSLDKRNLNLHDLIKKKQLFNL